MDTIIEMTRELAQELQNDERFVRTQMAQAAADSDEDLQGLIGEFNLHRAALNAEMSKDSRNEKKVEEEDAAVRSVYARLMANERMEHYQEAKSELDALVRYMVTILTMAAQGEDPNAVEEQGCGGDCSGCAGCH